MKLTKAIRESIISQVKQRTFGKEMADFKTKMAAELDKILIEKGAVLATEIPEKFTPFITVIRSVRVCRSSGYDREYLEAKSNFCSRHGNNHEVTNDEIIDAFQAIQQTWLEKESVINSVLYSCTTSKQLLETMPEFAEFLPDEGQPVGGALVSLETVEKAKAIFAGINA